MHRTAFLDQARTTTRPPRDPDPAALRPLAAFTAAALPAGWALLALPVLFDAPQEPFVLVVTFLGLLLPALLLTARRSGGAGVRALLRDAVRLPRPLWWVPLAAFALPAVVWSAAATRGAAEPLTTALLLDYLFVLVTGALIINIWEEMVWTGFVQRRAMARWGTVSGSLATAVLFAGIHLPLAFHDVSTAGDVALGVTILISTGVGLRLLIAALDTWTAGSLLTIGILHASFNATSDLIDPSHDWMRLVATVALGLAAVAVLLRSRRAAGHRPAAEEGVR
jgi:membrane protease YdiL (CAAX protease family)